MTLSSLSRANTASTLIRISAILYLAYYYMYWGGSASFNIALATCISLGILLLLALFIRQGHKWAKWVLLGLLFLTITPDVIGLPATFKSNIIAGCIAIVIDVLQISALVLLFKKDKEKPVTKDTEAL